MTEADRKYAEKRRIEREREKQRARKEKEKEEKKIKVIKERLEVACKEKGISSLCLDEMTKIVSKCDVSISDLFKERDLIAHGKKLQEERDAYIKRQEIYRKEKELERIKFESSFIGKLVVSVKLLFKLVLRLFYLALFAIIAYLLWYFYVAK